jgi:hypothetical protein
MEVNAAFAVPFIDGYRSEVVIFFGNILAVESGRHLTE